jgi:hypothetical protein
MEHIYDTWRLFEEKGINKKDGRANEEILLSAYNTGMIHGTMYQVWNTVRARE